MSVGNNSANDVQTQYAQSSPFDSIKQTNTDGEEFWSARDLQPLLGYGRWEDFQRITERARRSALNTNTAEGFTAITEQPFGTGRPRANYVLSRYAAYLVAMNGDPNMGPVAAAQSYFAVQTRVAEVVHAPLSLAERSLMVLEELGALVEAQKAQLEVQAPLVAQATAFREADGLRAIGDLANDLKVHAASNYPGVSVLHQDVFDLAGRLGLIIRGDTVRRNQPTARAIEAGWVKPKETVFHDADGAARLRVYTRLTPRGYGRVWDAAVALLQKGGL